MSIQWATLERVPGEGARGSSSELTDVALRWEAVSIINAGDAADRRETLPGAEAAGDAATCWERVSDTGAGDMAERRDALSGDEATGDAAARRERASDKGAGDMAARWDRVPDTGEGVARW